MDNEFYKKIESDLSEIKLTLNENTTTLAVQAEQLTEHMRRSAANEIAIEKVAEAVKPIQEHVAIVNFMGKSLTWVIGASGLVTLISRLFF